MIVLFLAAALAAEVAPAAAPAAPTPVAAVAAKPANDPVICHTDADVGSIIPHKTCLHQSEWAGIAADSKQAFRDSMSKTGQTLNGN